VVAYEARITVPPTVHDQQWIRNDIDRFILSKLEAKNLAPSPETDKRTLIRRASYDLIGLPPSAEDIDRFVKDTSTDAYEKLIDGLLASPRYGERWGRHWLDVARYADSVNDSVNSGQRFPWSYTYRDWVIQSLNEDLPYDRFVLYQLAADRVSGIEPRHQAALGFLSLGREFPKSYPETVDDRIDAVARGLLGLTVACARCHDHKYDPITQGEYYQLFAYFNNIPERGNAQKYGNSPPMIKAPTPAQQVELQRLDQAVADAEKKVAAHGQRDWETRVAPDAPWVRRAARVARWVRCAGRRDRRGRWRRSPAAIAMSAG